MASAIRRQDLPPSGGYGPVNYKRVPAKTFFNCNNFNLIIENFLYQELCNGNNNITLLLAWSLIGGYFAMTAGAAYIYYLNCKRVHFEEIEERSAQFAILPLILAEQDREYLKQLRRNRDEERKLMANVEGWKVGTYYGEPIYKLETEDILVEPRMQDYYVHAKYRDYAKRANFAQLT